MDRVFTYQTWVVAATYGFCLALIGGGSWFAYVNLTAGGELADGFLPAMLGVGAAGGGAWFWLRTGFRVVRPQVIFGENALIYTGYNKTVRIAYSDGMGCREVDGAMSIYENHSEAPALTFNGNFREFDELKAQVKTRFINLDQADLDASLAEAAEQDQRYGGSAAREQVFVKAATFAKYVQYLGYAVAAWTFYYPVPRELAVFVASVVALAIPFVGLAYKEAIVLNQRKNSVYPSLANGALVPAIAVAFRGIADHGSLELYHFVPHAFGFALVYMLICGGIWKSTTRRKFAEDEWAWLFGFGLLVGYGAMRLGNTAWDTSSPEIARSVVRSKDATGSKVGAFFSVELSPYENDAHLAKAALSKHLYDATEIGDTLLVHEYAGALGVPWRWVE